VNETLGSGVVPGVKGTTGPGRGPLRRASDGAGAGAFSSGRGGVDRNGGECHVSDNPADEQLTDEPGLKSEGDGGARSAVGTEQISIPPDLPDWLRPLTDAIRAIDPASRWAGFRQRTRTLPGSPRQSAVLILFAGAATGASAADADILITERASTLRSHAGQPAFPGGGIDPQDAGPVQAALREAHEEAGVDPDSVAVFGLLPELYLQPSDFMVASVLGWWRTPAPLRVGSPLEVASVHRVAIAELAAPENRWRVRHPSGYVGPAFAADGLLIWGFTAGLLDGVLRLGGWEQEWDRERVRDLPDDVIALSYRSSSLRPADQRPYADGAETDE
jgi:8-oxo-dGTP pyrophosphatase MutT (NUDIX family)